MNMELKESIQSIKMVRTAFRKERIAPAFNGKKAQAALTIIAKCTDKMDDKFYAGKKLLASRSILVAEIEEIHDQQFHVMIDTLIAWVRCKGELPLEFLSLVKCALNSRFVEMHGIKIAFRKFDSVVKEFGGIKTHQKQIQNQTVTWNQLEKDGGAVRIRNMLESYLQLMKRLEAGLEPEKPMPLPTTTPVPTTMSTSEPRFMINKNIVIVVIVFLIWRMLMRCI